MYPTRGKLVCFGIITIYMYKDQSEISMAGEIQNKVISFPVNIFIRFYSKYQNHIKIKKKQCGCLCNVIVLKYQMFERKL